VESETTAAPATLRHARGFVLDLLEMQNVTPTTTTPTRMTAWLEQAWMVRYLDRQLAGEEATWFEAYALDKPELLAMIEADTRLRDALATDASMWHMERSVDRGGRQGGATGEAPQRVSEPAPFEYARNKPDVQQADVPQAKAEVRAARTRGAPPWLAMAATLVLGVGLGWVGTRSLAPRGAAPEIVANPTRIIFDTMRGEPAPPRVEHAESTSPYVLIDVAVPPGAEHITLRWPGAAEQQLTPSPDGFVTFIAHRKEMGKPTDVRIAYMIEGRETSTPIRF
jgi:hypothetical protein